VPSVIKFAHLEKLDRVFVGCLAVAGDGRRFLINLLPDYKFDE
jgi:hypothetical protein